PRASVSGVWSWRWTIISDTVVLAGCGKTRRLMPGQRESSTTMHVAPVEEARMRGDDDRQQPEMWSYVPLVQRVPHDHPLRAMRTMVDAILAELSPAFDEIYSRVGRPSLARERWLRALRAQGASGVASERLVLR